jgi:hypothetical protein
METAFSVMEVWKGRIPGNISSVSIINKCGGAFDVGENYLVYAYGEDDRLVTVPCSRTTLLASAEEDLKALGEGRPPEIRPRIDYRSFAVGSFVLVLALSVGAVWACSRFLLRRSG